MPLLTPQLLHEISEIIARHHTAFVANVFGHDSVSPKVLEQLQAAGLIDKGIPYDAMTTDAYLYGQLLALLEDPAVTSWSAQQVKDYLKKFPIPLTPQEQSAVKTAKLTAGVYATGLGNVIEKETGQLLINADHELREQLQENIEDEVSTNIAARATVKQLKSALGHATQDWTRNLDRIAITEKQNAMQLGVAGQFKKRFGDQARVSLRCMPDACSHCKALTIGPDGHPRIFKLSQLAPPGANVKKPASQWVACIGAIHPHCQCQLIRIPVGWGFNKDGELVAGGKYGVEHDETEKSLLARVHDEEDHLTRLRKAFELAGRMEFHGLLLAIEQRMGDVRTWTDRHGASGSTTMTAPYGFIEGTKGKDGEAIDCYVGPNPDPTHVYVVNQKKKLAGGGFGGLDEQKTFIGFSSATEAKDCYLAHMNDPGFFGSMIEIPFEDFRKRVAAKIPETILKGSTPGARAQLVIPAGLDLEAQYTRDIEVPETFAKAQGQQASDHKYTSRKWSVDHWLYTYAGMHGGKVSKHHTDDDALALKLPKDQAEQLEAFRAKHNIPGKVIVGSEYAVLPMTTAQATHAWKTTVQSATAVNLGPKLTVPADPGPIVPHDSSVVPKVQAVQQAVTQDGAPKHITLSPEFHKFFGDWVNDPANASKVVDKSGIPEEQFGQKPIPMFHGTPVGGFSSFSKEKDKGQNIFGKGFYFTADKAIATEYTEKDASTSAASATGFRKNGEEVTHFSVEDSAKIRARILTPPGAKHEYGAKYGHSVHAQEAWALHAATGADGRIDARKFIAEFWKPSATFDGKGYSTGDGPALSAPPSAEAHWQTQNNGRHLYQQVKPDFSTDYSAASNGARAMQNIAEVTGAEPVVPPGQVFETYLSIRKPVDMDALIPEGDFDSFAEFTRKRQIPQAERSLVSAKETLAKHGDTFNLQWHADDIASAQKAHDEAQAKVDTLKKQKNYKGKKHDLEELTDAAENTASKLEQAKHSQANYLGPVLEEAKANVAYAEKRLAELKAPHVGTPAIHGTYLDDLLGIDEHDALLGKDKDISHPHTLADYVKIKEKLKSKGDYTHTDPHTGAVTKKKVMGIGYVGDQQPGKLTWGDLHWMMTNGHHDRGDQNGFREWAQSRGHDGIHHTGGWNIGSHEHSVWIAFEPTQIKATTAHEFDTSTPDIYKSDTPENGEGDTGPVSGGGVNLQVKGPPRPVHRADVFGAREFLTDSSAMYPDVIVKRDPKTYEYGDDEGRQSFKYTLKLGAIQQDPTSEEAQNAAAENMAQLERTMQQVLDVKRNMADEPERPPRMKKELMRPVEPVAKSEGEGSRGGHIVGHTADGKPIYERHNDPTVLEYAKQQLITHNKSIAVAAKTTAAKLHGGENMMIGPGVSHIDPKKLERSIIEELHAHASPKGEHMANSWGTQHHFNLSDKDLAKVAAHKADVPVAKSRVRNGPSGNALAKAGDHLYIKKEFHGGHWLYTYAAKHGGKVEEHKSDPNQITLKLPKSDENMKRLDGLKQAYGVKAAPFEGGKYAMLPIHKVEVAHMAAHPQLAEPPKAKPAPAPAPKATPSAPTAKPKAADLSDVPARHADTMSGPPTGGKFWQAGQAAKFEGKDATIKGWDYRGRLVIDQGGKRRLVKLQKGTPLVVSDKAPYQPAFRKLPEGAIRQPTAQQIQLVDKVLGAHVSAVKAKDWLVAQGHEVFLVGGIVRDLVQGTDPASPKSEAATLAKMNDVDYVSTAPPDVLRRMFGEVGATIPSSPSNFQQIGCVTNKGDVAKSDDALDVASLSSGGVYDSPVKNDDSDETARPATFDHDLEKDAGRRDFTMNALYYDVHNKAIIDPTGTGIADARSRTLRRLPGAEWSKNDVLAVRFWKMRARGYAGEAQTTKDIVALAGKEFSGKDAKYFAKQISNNAGSPAEVLQNFRKAMEADGAGHLYAKHVAPLEGAILSRIASKKGHP